MVRAASTDERVSIRKAAANDQHAIERLRASVRWSTAETGLTSMLAGRSMIYLLEVEGIPAASGALVLRSDDQVLADGSTTALISNLIVDPSFQSHGLGTKLLAFLENEAARRGLTKVTIGVDAPNIRARHLYERHEYRHLKDKSEVWGPVNYLVKSLTEHR